MPSADHCSSSERCQIEAARSALRIVEAGRPCLFQPCFVACATIQAAYSPALHRPSPQRRGIVFSCPQLVAFCVCVCACRVFCIGRFESGGHPFCAPRKHGCSPKSDLRRIAQAFCVYAHAHAHATRRYRALSAASTPPRRAVPARIGASNPRTERTNNREPHSRGTLLDYLMARGREPSGGGRATSERCRPRTRERVLGGIPRGCGRLRKRPLVSSSP